METKLESFVIKRDNCPPLKFKGEKIGFGSDRNHNSNRWNEVSLYQTAGGRFVAVRKYFSQWEGEKNFVSAEPFSCVSDLISWLEKERDGLGSVEQEAIESAAKVSSVFDSAWVENVE